MERVPLRPRLHGFAAMLGSVPVAIAYMFFVDQYVSGLTAGAVKG
jgi:ABC-type maltose transport system permease subunit